MAEVNEYRVSWTNLKGLPGVSTFYSQGLDPLALQARLQSFFTALKSLVPNATTWTVPDSGRIIDIGTGQATGMWQGGLVTVIGGSGPGAYVAPAGATINWNTSLFNAGRRLRGKTFIVPLLTTCFDSDGTLTNATVSSLKAAADAVPGGTSGLVVYSRRLGVVAPVTTAQVPDKAAVLRSRRD